MTYGYRAYGLAIRSDFAIPEMEPDVAANPDLTIRLAKIGAPSETEVQPSFRYGPDEQFLSWPGVASFLIRGADLIEVEPAAQAGEHLVRMPLLGPVLAFLLHLRGMLVLHASALEVGERSVVFMGDKGAGKSTTAAAMATAGHRLLTDDVVALDFSDPAGPYIQPGFPQIKLDLQLPDEFAIPGAVALPPPVDNFPKALKRLTGEFSHQRSRPARFYILDRGQKAEVTELSPQEAMTGVMRYSYISRFGKRIRTAEENQRHLRQCIALTTHAKVCRLEVPGDLSRISEAVKLIEADVLN